MGRVSDKIVEIEKYLSELEEIAPMSLEEYLVKFEKRLACERAFEKIVEAINDLAILFIKEKKLPIPSEDIKAFEVLSEKNFIPQNLAQRLKEAKGMRNVLIHQYREVNNELVFEAIDKEILKDAKDFIKELEKGLV